MKCGTLHLKKRKLWIWIAIEGCTQQVLEFAVGTHGKKALKQQLSQVKKYATENYATDAWNIYNQLIPNKKHLVGKKHTTQIESLNANVHHYLAHFGRRSRCYS